MTTRRAFLQILSAAAVGAKSRWLFAETGDDAKLVADVQQQIAAGLIRGAVIAMGNSERILYSGSWGSAQKEVPMTLDSQFDVASVTKTQVASALSLLAAQGKVELDSPFRNYLPEHTAKDSPITVRDLALHIGGFASTDGFTGPSTQEAIQKYLWTKQPVRPRGVQFEYVCYNYILLGVIVERVSGQRLDAFCRQHIYQPLGMTHSEWGPTPARPTSVEVIEARRLGGISDYQAHFAPCPIGNAGFFTTVGDLSIFCQQMLRRKPFPKAYYDLMFRCVYEKDGARRSFGWDMCDQRRPVGLSRDTIFHTGWTGQSCWIDPANDFFAVVLTNRFGDWEKANQSRQRLAGELFAMRK